MFLTKSDVNYKMMPLVPASTALMASKPKIGFSIDSIVGGGDQKASINCSPNSEDSTERHQSPFSDYYSNELRMRFQRDRDLSPHDLQSARRQSEQDFLRNTTASNANTDINKKESILNASVCSSPSTPTSSSARNVSPGSTSKSTTSPPNRRTPPLEQDSLRNKSRSPSPSSSGKRPIMVPGIPANLVRPFPVAPPTTINPEVKQIPAYLNSPEMVTTHPNPHFLAAQFQMAAALAHGQAGQGYPPGVGIPHHPGHPALQPREGYPLYPWLLSRHGRIFPHRFPGNFLLQPFRKPKRVRTAFSPSQLLKLEHAFENNHYVVGSERKTLAQNLNLSETQVKVWFQNRRTKHKRMQQEGDGKGGGNTNLSSSPNNNNDGSQISYDEDDELIDMEMEDCPSDDEMEMHRRQQQQYQHHRQ